MSRHQPTEQLQQCYSSNASAVAHRASCTKSLPISDSTSHEISAQSAVNAWLQAGTSFSVTEPHSQDSNGCAESLVSIHNESSSSSQVLHCGPNLHIQTLSYDPSQPQPKDANSGADDDYSSIPMKGFGTAAASDDEYDSKGKFL